MPLKFPDESTLTLFAEALLFWRIKCGYYKRKAPEGLKGGRSLVRIQDDSYGQLILDAYAYAYRDAGGVVSELNPEAMVFDGEDVMPGTDPPDNGAVMVVVNRIWDDLYEHWSAFRSAAVVPYPKAPAIEDEPSMAVALKTLLAFIPGAIGHRQGLS
ncbi:MAG: hypothetical protein OXH56_00250 [Gemmatimonadetes bacterium]|nr:hypothetical protein [Gemmatimonadota bacterium]